jgi:hypothetical protein
MCGQSFGPVVCGWCQQLQRKRPDMQAVCVTRHERAQTILEQTLHDAGVDNVAVWTVSQVHESVCIEHTRPSALAIPHILIFCEPQLNPWDTWLCIVAFGASSGSGRVRVAMCFWTYLDTEIYALDDMKYEFVSEWTKERAAVTAKYMKKLKTT